MAGIWEDLFGTTKAFFRIGLSGPRLKNSTGTLAIRNSADNADAAITCGTVNGITILATDTDGTLAANSNTILATQKAVKTYVDTVLAGVPSEPECKFATIAALPTVVYSNGSSGVGATLIAVGLGALALDGNTPSVNDSILVKNQVSQFQNGIYIVTTVGSAGVAFVLTRRSNFDQASEISGGDVVFIQSGTTNANTTWALSVTGAVVVGTTDLPWVQIGGPGSVTAGYGITVSGNQVAIDTTIVTSIAKLTYFGALAITVGDLRFYPDRNITLSKVYFSIGIAGSAAITIDVKKNGVSIFSGSVPTCTAGNFLSSVISVSTAITTADYLTVDISSVVSGSDLVAHVVYF